MQELSSAGETLDTQGESVYHFDVPIDQVEYLQRLPDRAHEEIAGYKRGFTYEIRRRLLTELITLAQTVESYLLEREASTTRDDCLEFLQSAVLGDIIQALSRYGVEPFVCTGGAINRRLQEEEKWAP